MTFNVQDFVSQLKLDGARNNYFQVEVTNPVTQVADNILPFMCQASELPASQINVIPVAYMGRTLKFAGVRPSFPDWRVTIINDEDFMIRNALETWHSQINSLRGNLRRFPTAAPSEYKSIAKVTQFGKTGEIIRVYQMFGLFPSEIGAIRLDYNEDNIERFDVTFAYDWWEITDGNTGNAGGPT